MKTRFIHNLITVIISLFVCAYSFGQESSVITIHVEKAGSLSSYIADSKKDIISNLKLSGSLNGTDFIFLKNMNNLEFLDLNDVSIVKGGKSYSNYNLYTKDNKITSMLFDDYKKLTEIIIPENIEDISANAFLSQNLKAIKVNRNNLYYTDIDGVLFNKDKTKLIAYPINSNTIYTVPESIIEISSSAFRESKIISINIPYNVEIIEDKAFWGCKNLTTVSMANSVEKIGKYAFWKCEKLNSIKLSDGLNVIESDLFEYCKSLGSIIIPEGVIEIKSGAFMYSNLSHITIPSTMEKISSSAFSTTCPLKEIYCYAQNPPEWNNSFLEIPDDAILYVPKGTYSAYWLAKGWGDFKNIVEMNDDPTKNEEIQPILNLNIVSNRGGISIEVNESTPIQLYDINGKLIWNKTVDGYTTIPLSKGVYVVHTKEQSYKVMVY